MQGKDRVYIEDALLPSQDGMRSALPAVNSIRMTDLLMTLVFMAKNTPVGKWITVPAYALLTALGRQTGGLQYRELRADISRLAAGMVSIRNTKAKIEFIGHHLISKAAQHEISRHWVYRLDPDLRAFYGEMSHTMIDWEKRRALQGRIWLGGYNYIWRRMRSRSRSKPKH